MAKSDSSIAILLLGAVLGLAACDADRAVAPKDPLDLMQEVPEFQGSRMELVSGEGGDEPLLFFWKNETTPEQAAGVLRDVDAIESVSSRLSAIERARAGLRAIFKSVGIDVDELEAKPPEEQDRRVRAARMESAWASWKKSDVGRDELRMKRDSLRLSIAGATDLCRRPPSSLQVDVSGAEASVRIVGWDAFMGRDPRNFGVADGSVSGVSYVPRGGLLHFEVASGAGILAFSLARADRGDEDGKIRFQGELTETRPGDPSPSRFGVARFIGREAGALKP